MGYDLDGRNLNKFKSQHKLNIYIHFHSKIYIRLGVIVSIIIQCTIFNKIKDVVNKKFNNKGPSIEF